MRLDKLLVSRFGFSRRRAQDAIRDGRVDVAGATVQEPGLDMAEDSTVAVDWNRPTRRSVRTRLTVLHEDDDLIVVDKPAGLLTVPTAAREKDTLLGRVSAYLQHRYRRRPYVGVVHRLDKDTSGTVVFARRRDTLRALQAIFKAHTVGREYVALAEGRMALDSGTIDRSLLLDSVRLRRRVARPNERGRRAVTRYRVLERHASATLVALRLETGRTHQIRIHLASIGHPVVGDAVYGTAGRIVAAPRQMLHAREIVLDHPTTGRQLRCESPLPPDFRSVLSALDAHRGRSPSKKKPRRHRRGQADRS
jgi:23S rRNA pseudouridine1911/1915/1917 synthase